MTESAAEQLASRFSHHDPELVNDPFETWQLFRDELRVGHSDQHGGFHILTRYEDVRAAGRSAQQFSSTGRALPPVASNLVPIYLDPPEHTEYRRLLNEPLSVTAAVQREPQIRAIVDRLLDDLDGVEEFDFIASFAAPFPHHVALDLVGVPEDEGPQMSRWVLDQLKLRGIDDDRALASGFAIRERIIRLVEEHRADPKPGTIATMLLDATAHGEPLSHDDLVGMITLVLFGGLDTTTTTLSTAMLYLLDHPDRWEALRADPDLLDTAIEEVIRWSSPIQATARMVTQDLEVAGCPMAAGDRVLLLWGSANHDERQFADPGDFVLDRSPNPHVGFGFGPHRCPGAPLAKVMLKISLAAVLERLPGLQRLTQDIVWTPGEAKNLRELRVRRTPVNAAAR
jgi:cytochrome P450